MKYEMGLCSGRHDVPVKGFIFNEISDPTDYRAMEERADAAIPADCTDLAIYVTGLTPAMIAAVKVCDRRGITLRAMHYDRASGEYKPQHIMSFETCPFCGKRFRSNLWVCPRCGST